MAKVGVSPTDARVVRTRQNLRQAALELAATGNIADISVAELARAANINRATFYKHADSPMQVLQEALIADLDALREKFLEESSFDSTDLAALWVQTTEATAEHLDRFEAIYRKGLAPDADGALLNLISEHIRASMEELFEERPDLLPKHVGQNQAVIRSAYATYLGNGLAGIMRVWFNSKNRSIEVYQALVLNALPHWMIESSAKRGRFTKK